MDLAAAGGVKGGAVEGDCRSRGFSDVANLGVEGIEEGVVVVEASGHYGFILITRRTTAAYERRLFDSARRRLLGNLVGADDAADVARGRLGGRGRPRPIWV